MLLRVMESRLEALLLPRAEAPFEGRWMLPGGPVRLEETLDETAHRTCRAQTGLEPHPLYPLQTFGALGRDPRERSIAITYFAPTPPQPEPEGDFSAKWHPVSDLPALAFDHSEIAQTAVERLRFDITRVPLAFDLLPQRFPLRDLQTVYEAVLGREIDKRNFRKKLSALGVVKQLKAREEGVAHRAANLFQFDTRVYQQRVRKGQGFELS